MVLTGGLMVASCSDNDYDPIDHSNFPKPTVSEFYPSEGYPSSIVTIKGTNFGATRDQFVIGRVYFGGVEAAEYVSWSDTEVQVRVPNDGKSGPISVMTWQNKAESTGEYNCLPGAEITAINPSPAFPGSQVTISGRNFQSFLSKGVTAKDVVVEFAAEEGTTLSVADEFTADEIKVTVPTNAKGGKISVKFGSYQTVEGPELPLVGDIDVPHTDYLEKSGTISIDDGGIGSTKRGAYVIYQIEAPATGFFDVSLMTGTTKDGSYLNVNISDNLNTLKSAALKDELTHTMKNTGSWATNHEEKWSGFYLTEGKTYYLRISFLQDGTTWVGNVAGIKLSLSADQSQTGNSTNGGSQNYTLYKQDFATTSYAPFVDSWAWSPSTIGVVDGALQFYYNAAALQQDNRRERRGCEVSCNFATATEGWYAFKVFLPESTFPMDESGIIIAQMFNQGCRNSWAGHLSIDKGELVLSHRAALVDPTKTTVGKLQAGKWYPVVMHFKVGRNNKGRIQVWLGDDINEANPTVDTGATNFGFGHWVNDETLDNTGTNSECAATSSYGGKDQIGCKFGLYVSNTKDITLRMDNLRALEGNPTGAFSIVDPR